MTKAKRDAGSNMTKAKRDAGSSHESFRQVVMDLLASRDRTFDDIQVRANNNNEDNDVSRPSYLRTMIWVRKKLAYVNPRKPIVET